MVKKSISQLRREISAEKRKERAENEYRRLKKEHFKVKYRKPLRYANAIADTTLALGKSTVNVGKNIGRSMKNSGVSYVSPFGQDDGGNAGGLFVPARSKSIRRKKVRKVSRRSTDGYSFGFGGGIPDDIGF